MELLTPDFGLIFWTTLTFLILVVLLRALAWKPILKAVNDREDSINEALQTAEKARAEIANLKNENEEIMRQARAERDEILKEAREIKDSIVSQAKQAATNESAAMIENARKLIENERMAAVTELKNSIGELAIDIAEKILKKELDNQDSQKALVADLVKDIKLN
ncbi:MAG: F0F1 ATP synthase subunit B [Schleiferiaceae bacterium]|jgi:F-type H+-transporting ATPase subunit b|nr:F0F1 ATP synthase subunit B [Schleiferiaceae bacterium]